ncbi:MAG: collagen-like protein [Sphingobacteriales bacterium]|nr:MAG: collagen-like protein [Sphingobacteriales bacterium]
MKPHTLITSFIIVTTTLLCTSCKKGDTGPAGEDGLPGIAGINGNANVRTDTFSVQSTDWKYNSIFWVGTSPNVSQGQISK